MMRRLACLAALALFAQAAAAERLMLGTWNLEWMMTPATFDELAARCLPAGVRPRGSERAIPCNIVPKARWDDADLVRLAAFAEGLRADVISLQEIDGEEVAGRIFRNHGFCFTKRRHVQNVGFAIRRGIPFRCNRDYRALGLEGNDVRWGADVTLYPGTRRELRLLAVHLKSACNRDPLTDSRPDCRTLQEQVPVLEAWIDRRAREGAAFAVIGDFNRRFDRERGGARDGRNRIQSMWPELDDGEPAGSDLVDAGADARVVSCNNEDGARAPIDHFVLGRRLARRLVPDSFRDWDYRGVGRWPDHCLLTIEVELEARDGV
jgi:hypothetical protein